MSYSTFYLNSQSSDGIIDGSNVIIGGNVGIQTNTPEYSLDINGTFRSSSIVTHSLTTENIILTDSSLNPYSIQSRIEHTKLVENIVTVGTKTSDAANSSGSSSAFFIDNIETPYLHFTLGKKYRFIQTDSTNTGHPLRFYLDEDKTTQFTTNVTVSGTPGVDSTAYVEISVSSSTPQILYYQCSSHSYMGNAAYSKSTSGLNNISVNDLSDVSFNSTTAEDGNALVWNATSGEWEAGIIVSNKPAFQGVDLSGYDLLLKFTENIKNVSTYDPTDFTVNVKSVNRSVDSIAIANGDVNLIMDTGGQTGGVETLIGGELGSDYNVTQTDGSIEDSRFRQQLRGLSIYGDYLYVCTVDAGNIRRFNIATQTWSTFISSGVGFAIGGMTRDGVNFYVIHGTKTAPILSKFSMNVDNVTTSKVNIYNSGMFPGSTTYITSFTMSNDGQYIYIASVKEFRKMGISRYTIATGVFENYKTSGLTTNSYSDSDYLIYNSKYYNVRLAIDDNYLYFGYNWRQYAINNSKIGRISLSTDAIEMSWKTAEYGNSWFIGSTSTNQEHDDVTYQAMTYRDGYLYFNGNSTTGKILKTSVNDSTNTVTEVGDYVGHIVAHQTLPYLYYAGFIINSSISSYDSSTRKGTVWQLTLDVPSYQTFDPITSVDNLTIKYVKNSTSSKNLLGDPSEFVVDNFNYVGTDITGIINGADISFNSIEASSIVINGDISANDASFNVIDADTIFIEGSNISTSLNSKQAIITESIDVSLNNLKVHGDLSANDASFNVIDVSAILVQGRDLVGSGVSEAMDTLKELADALDSSANFAANVTTRLSTIESDLASKQDTISTNDLSLGDISGLYTQLESKQDTLIAGTNITITGNTISASGGSGGGSADITESSITDLSDVDISYNDISDGQVLIWNDASGVWNSGTVASVEDISGLYTQLDSKQDTLIAGTDISIVNNTISYTGNTSTDISSTPTKQGQVLETLAGICDGRTITVESGTYTLENVTATQITTTSYTDISGTSITYTPPQGAKQVIFDYHINMSMDKDDSTATNNKRGLILIQMTIDGSSVDSQMQSWGDDTLNYGESILYRGIIDINGTDSISNGTLASWSSGKTVKLRVIAYGTSYNVRFHANQYGELGSNTTVTNTLIKPRVKIKSIGELSGQVLNVTNTVSYASDISFNNVDISGVLATNKSNNQISLGGHIIPITNSTYDLGSAEYKIRHLYLSNNSLWLGEDHKIEVSDGKMKFRKLQKDALPSGLNAISGASISDAITVLGKPVDTPASSFTLADWEAYSIAKGRPLRVDEIFLPDDINDDNGLLDTINGTDISFNTIDASTINVTGDISANDASFNVIDVSAIFIEGSNVTTRLSTIETDIAGKQAILTAGTNITITDNTISASGGGSTDITESSITDLSDVDISYSNISNGQALIWNDASGVWKPGTITSTSGSTINSNSNTDLSVNNLDISGDLKVDGIMTVDKDNSSLQNSVVSNGNEYSMTFTGNRTYNNWVLFNTSGNNGGYVPEGSDFIIEYEHTMTRGSSANYAHFGVFFEGPGTELTSDNFGQTTYFMYAAIYWTSAVTLRYWGGRQNNTNYYQESSTSSSPTVTLNYLTQNTVTVKYEYTRITDNIKLYFNGVLAGSITWSDNFVTKPYGKWGFGEWNANTHYITNPRITMNNITYTLTTIHSKSDSNPTVTGPTATGDSFSYSAPSLDVSGNGVFSGTVKASGNILSSDDRLKHNEIIPTTPLESIMKLTPKQYFKTKTMYDISHNFQVNSKGIPINTNGNVLIENEDYTKETGIIAQDLQLIPELKYTVKNNNAMEPLGVDYNSIFCTHIAATQELCSIINNQKLIVEQQQQEIESLKLINKDMNKQLNDVLNENNSLKNDIQFIKNYLGIN